MQELQVRILLVLIYVVIKFYLSKGEMDYVPIQSQMERVLTDATRSACINITIHTNNMDEIAEKFSIELLYVMPLKGFFVIPDITTVTIVDITGE